jgi:hypothetical protein
MKIDFFILILLFFCSVAHAGYIEHPNDIIAQVENTTDMSFGEELRVLLALADYHRALVNTQVSPEKEEAQIEKIYKRAIQLVPTVSLRDLSNNVESLNALTEQLDKSPNKKIQADAQTLRQSVIYRSLHEAQNDQNQNMSMDSFGGNAVVALAEQLGGTEEFKGIFTAALKSFPTDPKEEQSLARTKTFLQLIEQNRAGFGSNGDDRAQLHTDLEDAKKEYDKLNLQPTKSPDDLDRLKSLELQIADVSGQLEAEDKINGPCWVDPRIPLDDSTLKGFTCAAIAVAMTEDDSSYEALNLLVSLSMGKPFSNYADECSIDLQKEIASRNEAVTRESMKYLVGAGPFDCKLPDDLSPVKKNKPAGYNVGQVRSRASFVFENCDQYIADVRESREALSIFQGLSECSSYKDKGENSDNLSFMECLDRFENEAGSLSDERAIPILAEIAENKLLSGALHPERTLLTVISRFQNFFSAIPPEKMTLALTAERDQMMNKIDRDISQYVVSSWKNPDPTARLQGFQDAIDFSRRISDPGLRNILLIHVVEAFGHQGSSTLQFNDPNSPNPSAS